MGSEMCIRDSLQMRVRAVDIERERKLWNVAVVDSIAFDTAAPGPLAQVTRALAHAIGEIGNVSQSLRSVCTSARGTAATGWPGSHDSLLTAVPSRRQTGHAGKLLRYLAGQAF